MVGSRCVVQDCSNGTDRAAGIALHASPTDSTRDVWLRFVRTKRKNFHPNPRTRFVICSIHFEETCFTRAFDPSQRRQIKRGSLPSIWKKGQQPTDRESGRNLRMKEKKRQEVSFIHVCVTMREMCEYSHTDCFYLRWFVASLLNTHTNSIHILILKYQTLIKRVNNVSVTSLLKTFPKHRTLWYKSFQLSLWHKLFKQARRKALLSLLNFHSAFEEVVFGVLI